MGGFSLGGGAGGLGAAEMSVFLMMLEEPWQLPGGARDPRGRGRPGPDCGGGELGGSAGVPRGRRTWITWERRKFVVLSSLGDPPEDALLLYVASA